METPLQYFGAFNQVFVDENIQKVKSFVDSDFEDVKRINDCDLLLPNNHKRTKKKLDKSIKEENEELSDWDDEDATGQYFLHKDKRQL